MTQGNLEKFQDSQPRSASCTALPPPDELLLLLEHVGASRRSSESRCRLQGTCRPTLVDLHAERLEAVEHLIWQVP